MAGVRLRFALLLAAALALEEALHRGLPALGASGLTAWTLPWAPVGLCLLWHGARLPRWQALLPSAATAALVFLSAEALLALAGDPAEASGRVLAEPLRWAAIGFPLWTALSGLTLALAWGTRRALS